MSIPWTKEQLMKANDKLMKKNQRYKQALEYYADEKRYMYKSMSLKGHPVIIKDGGEIARRELRGDNDA